MEEVVSLSNGCAEHPKTRKYSSLSGTGDTVPSPQTNSAVLLNDDETITVGRSTPPPRPSTAAATRETHEGFSERGRRELSVTVVPSKRERLKRLAFASELQKVAAADRNAKFDRCDEKRLAVFEQYLANNDRELFRGFPANRRLDVSLVSIGERHDSTTTTTTTTTTPETYICIHGLRNEAEIVKCHAVLSQKLVRDMYNPLRLCYDRSQIMAADDDDDDDDKRLPV